jgi:ribonuclease E
VTAGDQRARDQERLERIRPDSGEGAEGEEGRGRRRRGRRERGAGKPQGEGRSAERERRVQRPGEELPAMTGIEAGLVPPAEEAISTRPTAPLESIPTPVLEPVTMVEPVTSPPPARPEQEAAPMAAAPAVAPGPMEPLSERVPYRAPASVQSFELPPDLELVETSLEKVGVSSIQTGLIEEQPRRQRRPRPAEESVRESEPLEQVETRRETSS